ncbi:MAG: hypothetical protein IKV16_00345, partial [Clostridia bacterium]|nr:hypothetical protein [Clostridia bacterium]
MNADVEEAKTHESEKRRGIFDSIEIKGLSSKSARAFSSGKIAKTVRHLARLLAFTSARVYGIVFLSFGLLTLFLHLGEYYIMRDPVARTSSMVIGGVFILLSVFLLVSEKPICTYFRSRRVLDFIVFDFFLINRVQKNSQMRGLGASFGALVGFLLSLVGFFFPTEYAVAFIIGFIFVSVSFISPEFPYICSLLAFPYLPLIPYSSYLLAACVLISLVSYLRKVLVGKRIYSLEIYDILLVIFLITVFVSLGVGGGGARTTERALLLSFLILGYVPASNMPLNRRLFDCVSGAMIASAIPVSLISIVQYALNYSFYDRVPSRAFFNSAEMLALYLISVAIFALYLSVKRVHKRKKIYYSSVFIISAVALVTTECFAALLAAALFICAYAILRSRRIPNLFILLLLALPYAVLLVGHGTLLLFDRVFFSSIPLTELGEGARGSVRALLDNPFFGVGKSDLGEIFSGGAGIYISLGMRLGIFALATLLVIIVIRLLHLGVHKKLYRGSAVG